MGPHVMLICAYCETVIWMHPCPEETPLALQAQSGICDRCYAQAWLAARQRQGVADATPCASNQTDP